MKKYNRGEIDMQKKIGIVMILLICFIFPVLANQRITKVGVIDKLLITQTFIDKSKNYTDYETYKKNFEEKVAAIQAKINNLQLQKLDAQQNSNNVLVTKLDNQILTESEYLREYFKLAKNELKVLIQKITSSDDFSIKLKKAIAQVSEEEGYSVILDISDNSIPYYASDVDITDLVIRAMNKLFEKK